MATTMFMNTILPGHEWDLKSNTNTIFGIAWKYDQDIKSKTGGDNRMAPRRAGVFLFLKGVCIFCSWFAWEWL